MSRESRALTVGDKVTTDFSGRITAHQIVEVAPWPGSTSGIGFRVAPDVPRSSKNALIDADWFESAP